MQVFFRAFFAFLFCFVFYSDICARPASFAGAGDFTVNADVTFNKQEDPSIAVMDDGNFVVSYTTWPTGHGSAKFRFRKFDREGNQIGETVSINNQLSGTHKESVLVPGDDNTVIVAFQGRDGSHDGVFVQALNSDLTPSGDTVMVNTETDRHQFYVDIKRLNSGNYIVVWTKHLEAGVSSHNVFGQLLDESLNKIGSELSIAANTGFNNTEAQIGVLSDDRFVVVWQAQDGGNTNIHGRMFSHTGNAISSIISISDQVSSAKEPDIVVFDNDEVLVSWEVDNGTAQAQRYNDDWSEIRDVFQIQHQSQTQESVKLVPFSDGSYLVVSTEKISGGDTDVFAQHFSKFDRQVGHRFSLASVTEESQFNVEAAIDATGNFMVVWEGNGELSDRDVMGRIFTRQTSSFRPDIRPEKSEIRSTRTEGFRTQISIDDDTTDKSEMMVTVSAISNPDLLPTDNIDIVDGTLLSLSSLSFASTETFDKIVSFNVVDGEYGVVTVDLKVVDGDNLVSTTSITLYVLNVIEAQDGLVLWLDGSDPLNTGIEPADESTLSSWIDKSGSSNSLVQGTAARQPTFLSDSQNDLGVISFDGSNAVMSKTNILGGTDVSDVTIFAVYRTTENVSEARLYGFGETAWDSDTTGNRHLNIAADQSLQFDDTGVDGSLSDSTNFVFRSTIKSGDTYSDFINGSVNIDSEALSSFSIQDDVFVGGFTYASNVEIAEIVVFTQAVTGDAREEIEELLAEKWNITAIIGESSGDTPEIIGQALVYPNPFRATEGAQYGYELAEDMDVKVHVFNSMGRLVQKSEYTSGETGGQSGYNKVAVNSQSAFGKQLPAGAYFFVLSSNGDIIGKGKFAIVP